MQKDFEMQPILHIQMIFQAIVKSSDDKAISFEWSVMPTVVRRALKWLF